MQSLQDFTINPTYVFLQDLSYSKCHLYPPLPACLVTKGELEPLQPQPWPQPLPETCLQACVGVERKHNQTPGCPCHMT